MDDLVAWLRAQLDEDERVARAASDNNGSPSWREDSAWFQDMLEPLPSQRREHPNYVPMITEDEVRHIARHDPGRVLREVESKRVLLDDLLAAPHFLDDGQYYGCEAIHHSYHDENGVIFPERYGRDLPTGKACTCGRDADVKRRVGLLALPYADRPGYREEWQS